VHATVGWTPSTGDCANACHGVARPRWTAVGEGEIACGTCHGIPPPSHDPEQTILDCATCHPAGFEHHIDGVVDLR
jgi:hypothetical protein